MISGSKRHYLMPSATVQTSKDLAADVITNSFVAGAELGQQHTIRVTC
jgi:hypothetical protein